MTARVRMDPVARWDTGETVYLAVLPGGPITVLEGSAAVIWRAACDGPLAETADRVAPQVGIDADAIRGEVDSLVDRLVSEGLLAPG